MTNHKEEPSCFCAHSSYQHLDRYIYGPVLDRENLQVRKLDTGVKPITGYVLLVA